jgi:putative cardiolipin synthase
MARYPRSFCPRLRNALLPALLCLLAACGTLPPLERRSESHAYADTAGTRLGQVITPMATVHPGQSGIHPLLDARDAFAARVHLAHTAERSLDVQYYIWHKDMTGTLLFDALRAAAERGVRVRLLLDDNNTGGLDATLAALDSHPGIEVRLFNPLVARNWRWLNYLTDFRRANRRMHNKSFTADNQVTIIGGRNVGDEYFGATSGVLFSDLDVMAVGAVVQAVSDDFDRYWRSASAYPAPLLLAPAAPDALATLAAEAEQLRHQAATSDYIKALRASSFVQELTTARLPLEWAVTRIVSDDPAKALGRAEPSAQVPYKLKSLIGDPVSQVSLVSPYFVPSESVDVFTELADRGVKVDILTNALEATDVAAVHAGYARHREPLLEAGVKLYELKRLAPRPEGESDVVMRGSSSATSLHAKTFSVDRSRLFVGSFNFDPRSARLNTEIGFVIDSPALAGQLDDAFSQRIPASAYQVQLGQGGRLFWTEQRNGQTIFHETEPGASLWQRFCVWLLSLLPIDSLL